MMLFAFASCKKSTTPPGGGTTPPVTGAKTCQLSFWKATETANPYFFEYSSTGKLAKARVYTNGNSNPPNTTQFEYDSQNRLTRSYDSAALALNNQYTSITVYSDYNAAGYPLHSIERVKAHRDYETDYEYNAKNSITRAIIQTFDINDALYSRDTVAFTYDATENFLSGIALTLVNGVRTRVTAFEVEGYDTKSNFYKSLGNEFNLHRIANADAMTAAGYYGYSLYMPSANNPLKVYLHNQGLDNKGDYLTYTYEYDASTGLPSKISFMNTSGGLTRGPGFATALYTCK
jgi:hypothetical protein